MLPRQAFRGWSRRGQRLAPDLGWTGRFVEPLPGGAAGGSGAAGVAISAAVGVLVTALGLSVPAPPVLSRPAGDRRFVPLPGRSSPLKSDGGAPESARPFFLEEEERDCESPACRRAHFLFLSSTSLSDALSMWRRLLSWSFSGSFASASTICLIPSSEVYPLLRSCSSHSFLWSPAAGGAELVDAVAFRPLYH